MLPRGLGWIQVMLPEPGIVLGGEALEVTNGDGLIHLTAAALCLAGAVANMAQSQGKRSTFSNYGDSFGKLALGNEAHVAGDIYASRTGILTGDKRSLALALELLVHQSAGGADLNAGAAELASGIGKGRGHRADNALAIHVNEAQGLDAADILACPDAAGTPDAQIVVSFK